MTDDARLTSPTTLEIVRDLPGPRQRIWDHLVDPDLRRRWFCGGAIEPRPGGVFVFDFDHRRLSDTPPPEKYADQQQVRFEGTVTIFEPPAKLAFLWPEEDGASTEVTITLTERGDRVELHLIHARLARPDHRTGAAAGWHVHLDLLDDLLAGRAVRDFWAAYVPVEDRYRAEMEG